MTNSCNQRIRTDHHMIADIHLTDVKDGQVEVACEVIADKDVLAAVAAERLGYPHSLTNTTKHLFQIGVL